MAKWQVSEGDWCHVEIPTADAPAARRFYEEVFGWQSREFSGVDYQLVKTSEDGITGGIGGLGESYGHPVSYVCVKGDMAQVIQRIEKAGGKVLRPETQFESEGSFAHVADPEGNVIGLWKDA